MKVRKEILDIPAQTFDGSWLSVVTIADPQETTIYCPIRDSFDNAKMLNWIGWWDKEINWDCPSPTRTNGSSLVQVSINHSMRDCLPTTLHLPSIPLGIDRLTVSSWGHWEARTLWRVSILQHLIPLAGCPLSKIVLLWQLGKGSVFLWSFLMVYLWPFPLRFGLGLCARSLVSSLGSLSFGSGLVLSANIFRVHGFLSSFWVEIWSLAPRFCLAFYFLHFKFQIETFSIIFNLTWCCTCQELWLSYDFSPRSMIGSS